MSAAALIPTLAPPRAPIERSAPYGWDLVELVLGCGLPGDYKAFIERYGTGDVVGQIRVLNPLSANPAYQLGRQMLERLATIPVDVVEGLHWSGLQDATGASRGWLLWGISTSGDGLYWRMTGAPDSWSVATGGPGEVPPRFRDHGVCMTAYLADLCRGKPTTFEVPGSTGRAKRGAARAKE